MSYNVLLYYKPPRRDDIIYAAEIIIFPIYGLELLSHFCLTNIAVHNSISDWFGGKKKVINYAILVCTEVNGV